LTFGGRVVIIASADIAGSSVLGDVFLCARTSFSVAGLPAASPAGAGAYVVSTGNGTGNTYLPICDSAGAGITTENIALGTGASFSYAEDFGVGGGSQTGNCFKDLSAGDWLISFFWKGVAGVSIDCGMTDDLMSYGGEELTNYQTLYEGSGSGSYTSAQLLKVISVPPGIPRNVPSVFFYRGTVTSTASVRVHIVKIDEDLFTSDVYPAFAPSSSSARLKRLALFQVTQQGVEQKTQRALSNLSKQMRRMAAEEAAPTRALHPTHLSSTATRAAAGTKW
jgi:hypothetical protein